MNMTEQRTIINANMIAYLHGGAEESEDAARTMHGTIDSNETYVGLVSAYLTYARNALRTATPETAAAVATGAAFYAIKPAQDTTDRAQLDALQLINTWANDDVDTLKPLIHNHIDHATPQHLGEMLYHLREYTRTLHLAVCAGAHA